jgi:AcrR family transcriptional regulator
VSIAQFTTLDRGRSRNRHAGGPVEQAQRTRERVLAAARGLFAERGYFGTGTTDIVQAAGVGTRGALYHHFPDRPTLFRAVFEQVEVDLIEQAGAAVAGKTGFEVLVAGLTAFLVRSLVDLRIMAGGGVGAEHRSPSLMS